MKNFILISILLFNVMAFSACSKQQEKSIDTYDFPVTPGTEQWSKLTSHNEMINACQVPEYILKGMSTKGLVITVINYPLSMDGGAYSTPQSGIEAVINQFNGLNELMNREDSGTEILGIYKELSQENIEGLTGIQKGRYIYLLSYIESIFAQNSIITKLSDDEIYELINETNNRYDNQISTTSNTLWLMGKALKTANYEPFIKKVKENKMLYDFLENGFKLGLDDNASKIILDNAETYLSERK